LVCVCYTRQESGSAFQGQPWIDIERYRLQTGIDMIDSTARNLRLPIYGQANLPPVSAQAGSPFCPDPVLEARKGRLYLLATPDADRDLLRRFALHYYHDPSFDIIPTLQKAMAFAHSDLGLEGTVHVAVVVHDLSMYIVATDEGDVYQVRAGTVSHPLDEHSFRTELAIPAPHGRQEPEGRLPVRSIKARLTMGDAVVLGLRLIPAVIGKAVPHILRQAQDPMVVAARLSRVARSKARIEAPYAVIMMPGLSSTSAAGLLNSRPPTALPEAAPSRLPALPRERHSAVRIAFAFAVLAVAFSLWVTKPRLDRDAISNMFLEMLTPVATETPLVEGTPPPPQQQVAPAP